jgi:hypothetical protein
MAIKATKVSMKNLSAYGVKILLPIFLKGLDENSNKRAILSNIWALVILQIIKNFTNFLIYLG